MVNIKDPVKTTVEEISKFLDIKNVVVKAIETDDFLIIPVARTGMGFVAGNFDGEIGYSAKDMGSGGAGGVEPISIIVVNKGVTGPEGVEVLSLKAPEPISMKFNEIKNSVGNFMGQKRSKIKKKKEMDDEALKVAVEEVKKETTPKEPKITE
jgi:uncharacterized spore protein YtfJ